MNIVKSFFQRLNLVLFLAAGFCSCSMLEDAYNEPIKDFFETYMETAAIELYEIPSGSVYVRDPSGVINIPSDDDFKFRFLLRNPKMFDFTRGSNLTVRLDSLDVTGAKNFWGVKADASLFEVRQDSDKSVFNVTIRKELLEVTDCGFDITPTLTMKHPLTNESFGSYGKLKLISNSAPAPASGYVFYTDPATNRYVILFNLPSRKMMLGKHRDIKTLSIDDHVYDVSISGDGTVTLKGDGSCRVGIPSSFASFIPSGKSSFVPNGQPCAFFTGHTATNENIKFTMSLTDKTGLSSSVDAYVRAERLNEATAYDFDGEKIPYSAGLIPLVQDEDQDYASFKVVPPSSTKEGTRISGSEVLYEVYQGSDDSGTLLASGKITEERILKLPLGFVFVRFYSHKSPYADSDVLEWKFKVAATILYVSRNGNDASGNGTRSNPFATVRKAIASFEDKTNTNFVRLMTDVSENVSLNDSAANYTIMGYRERKNLTGNITLSAGTLGFTDVAVAGTADVTGGTFRLAGSTRISGKTRLSNGSVPIYVASDFGLGTEKVLTVSPALLSENSSPIIVGESGSLNTALALNVDVVDDTGGTDPSQVGYYLSISGGKGYCKQRSNQGFANIYSYSGVENIVLSGGISGKISQGATITPVITCSSGTSVTVTKIRLIPVNGTEDVATGVSNLVIPAGCKPGSYIFYMEGTGNRMGSQKWSYSQIINVSYAER